MGISKYNACHASKHSNVTSTTCMCASFIVNYHVNHCTIPNLAHEQIHMLVQLPPTITQQLCCMLHDVCIKVVPIPWQCLCVRACVCARACARVRVMKFNSSEQKTVLGNFQMGPIYGMRDVNPGIDNLRNCNNSSFSSI